MTPPEQSEDQDDASFAQRSRWWRYGLAVVLVVAAIFAPLLGGWEVCAQELADTGEAVTVCKPAGLTDVPVFAGLVLLALLFWPDVSEISVGVLSLKKQVEEEAKETREAIDSIRLDVRAASQASAQNLNVFARGPLETTEDLEAAVRQLFGAVAPVAEASTFGRSHSSPEYDTFLATLSEAEGTIAWAEVALEEQQAFVWGPSRPHEDISAYLDGSRALLGVEMPTVTAVFVAQVIKRLVREQDLLFRAAASARRMGLQRRVRVDPEVIAALSSGLADYLGEVERVAKEFTTDQIPHGDSVVDDASTSGRNPDGSVS